MRGGAGRFVLGIEGLTALVTGAAALVAFVSSLVLWLLVSDARSSLEAASYSRAQYIAAALGSRPSQSSLETLLSSSVPGAGILAVAVTTEDGLFIAYPSASPEDIHNGNNVTYITESGIRVTIVSDLPPVIARGWSTSIVLASLAVFLTVVAVLVPSYLRRSVLDPLRNILSQADRIEKGGGSSAQAADASFGKLVDLLTSKDIQLLEMREEALSRAETAESRSGAVLEAMGSAVAVLDLQNRPTLWNSQASALFGPIDQPDGEASLLEHLAPFIQHERNEWDGEKDQRTFRFKATKDRTDETVVLITDVTASLAMERKLAEESALADLGALSGGVAHEIGNALCALDGFIQLLGRGGESERTRDILREAALELDSARNIVEAFRNLSHQSCMESSFAVQAAAASIEEICELNCVGLSSAVIPEGSLRIPGGQILISRILENLLSNALRYCGPDGVSVSVRFEDDEFMFSVEDSGPGLPSNSDIVFRPMYTTEAGSGGMGLGLTITRRLVSAMGGSIRAANRETGGAVFTVTIPILEESS